jgi:hypothetical protein
MLSQVLPQLEMFTSAQRGRAVELYRSEPDGCQKAVAHPDPRGQGRRGMRQAREDRRAAETGSRDAPGEGDGHARRMTRVTAR